MASIGHVAVGLAAARAYRDGRPVRWASFTSMVVWSGLSLLPDADVVGSRLGIHYEDTWGHRGATHSLAMSLAGGGVAALVAWAAKLPIRRTALFATLVLASHGLLDTLTDGGLDIALLWPFSDERFFAPWNPIPVAPIGLAFFSESGLRVAAIETVMFLPLTVYGLWPRGSYGPTQANPGTQAGPEPQ